MKLNGNGNGLLELFYKLICAVGLQKTCHILDAYGVCAHFLKLLCIFSEGLVCMVGACGVADGSLNVPAFFFCSLYSCLEVSRVVERVEYTENIYAVGNRLLNEVFNNIV